ncbi:S-adenosyl-L-methionine-dependent methyltransferase [Hyaloraphidium curvatum]|nr:S-adenosyl-L-methionine-dependent methyltransferase [Hyaloraphidium curvatum]
MMGAENGSAAKSTPVWPSAKGQEPFFATRDGRPNLTVKRPPYPVEGFGKANFSNLYLVLFCLAVPRVLLLPFGYFSFSVYLFLFVLTAVPSFAVFNYCWNYYLHNFKAYNDARAPLPGKNIEEYITINDPELKARFHGRNKIPMELLFEGYIAGKIDFKGDVLETLEQRYDFVKFEFCLGQAKFLFFQWIPELLWHSRRQDEDQVQGHYDRGDDFYEAFLGPTMTYTSGMVGDKTREETLEELQVNKYNAVLRKSLFNRSNLRHLDIGCGWGPLVVHAAKHFQSDSTGVTISVNQTRWGNDWALKEGVAERARLINKDYRDIPKSEKWDRITCLEMAEHVGVLRFQTFMRQVYDLLEDDGIFFMQVAGLRRSWQYEDIIWGLFMAKYIFPGADASTPLNWYVNQLEWAGFEVQSTETLGTHYSATIWRWYKNWMKNQDKMQAKYGQKWLRIWNIFLAWSTIISRQGSATVYQFVCHKNRNGFDRTRFQAPRDQLEA